ncbi:MAG: ArsR family transcriptional regulator [Candidatus Micrarchaeota archaeon]|nr:ArsR family transcriptional regulator [Candidatus Micrarchaeota archaeon]
MESISLLGATKRKMAGLMLGAPQSVAQLARKLRIQKSAVRKHLDSMVAGGLASQKLVVQGVGRPKKFYLLTEAAKEMMPRQYDSILNLMVEIVSQDQDKEYASRLMERVAQKVNAGFEMPSGGAKALKESNSLGFMPTMERIDGKTVITSRNCPLMKVAFKQGEVVCASFHENLLKFASGAKSVKREKWMNTGDPVCTHAF